MIFHGRNRLGETVIFLLFSLCLVFYPGLTGASTPETGGTVSPEEAKAEYNPAYEDCARFLAGIPARQGSLTAYEKSRTWMEYARFIEKGWEKLVEKQLNPMREWASRELGTAASSDNTVFYPFSGPDFINAFTFFPEARTYVLIGLEPLGQLPDPWAMSDTQFDSFFAGLKRSLNDLLNFNYFVSAHMKENLMGTEVKGVLPVLLAMLARENAHTLDVRYWQMSPEGVVRDFPALKGVNREAAAVQGVRIIFETAGTQKSQPRTLYYFRFNLYNSTFERNRYFVSYLKSLAPLTTFMKSASYGMFDPHISAARQFVLEKSRYILQEDSGIPLKYFDPGLWNLHFYGVYTHPIAIFKHDFQQDLAGIYTAGKDIKPLPFGIGYHFEPGTANLMFAVKKEASGKHKSE